MKGCARAVGIILVAFVFVAGSESDTCLQRIFAAISRSSAIRTASADLDAPLWKEREAKLRTVHTTISPAIGIWDRNGTHFIPEWTGSFQGLSWAGNGSLSGAVDGGGAAEIGLLLLNSDRKKVAYTGKLVSLSKKKAKLLREAVLLDGLKTALILRVDLGMLEEEDTARKSFDRFVDTMLFKLRPFVEVGLIPANSLNNILGLKESNLEQAYFLFKESELLKKRSRETLLLDSADFLPLDIHEFFFALNARNRSLLRARSSYENQLDSLEYEIAKAQLEMERIRDNQMFVGVGMEGLRKSDAPLEKGYRIRIGWNVSLGPGIQQGKMTAPALPLHTVEPEQQDNEYEMGAISTRVRKQLNEALAGRLSEIRLGQVTSVFAISENLSRLLDNSLLPIVRRHSDRLHAILRAESLEEFGLGSMETTEVE